MIASLTANALQISGMVCQLERPTRRTVACSHLIEYTPKGARYARSDASGRSACWCSERGRSERAGPRGMSTVRSTQAPRASLSNQATAAGSRWYPRRPRRGDRRCRPRGAACATRGLGVRTPSAIASTPCARDTHGRARTHGHRCWVGLTRPGNRRGPAEAVRGVCRGRPRRPNLPHFSQVNNGEQQSACTSEESNSGDPASLVRSRRFRRGWHATTTARSRA
jgi:hypothetical protein